VSSFRRMHANRLPPSATGQESVACDPSGTVLVGIAITHRSHVDGSGQDPGDRLQRNRDKGQLNEVPNDKRQPTYNDQGGSETGFLKHAFHHNVTSFQVRTLRETITKVTRNFSISP
ncbi:MAG TPA: hypothetical protein PLK09_16655, partial [Verrucomicrobiota bacterium]|nr:hypothetical protein [Verrucomicrobiota bacterium]